MKKAVIWHLIILIALVIFVRCDDDDDEYDLGDDEDISTMKCLVCRATIQEMENVVKTIDPNKKVEVSGFGIDGSGRSETKTVQYSKSETFLSDLMESICEDEKFKKIRLKIIQKIVVNQMLANQGALDFSQCLEILEDSEEAILKYFMAKVTPKTIDHLICTKYCDDGGDDNRDEL